VSPNGSVPMEGIVVVVIVL